MNRQFLFLAICADSVSRKRAEQFCVELQSRFWQCFDVAPFWFMEPEFSRPTLRRKAAELACEANLILFALMEHPMTSHLSAWAESALEKRGEREGHLVLLSNAKHTRNELILRHLAHRRHLDFLTELPPNFETELPESPEPYTRRAQAVSGLLDDILRSPRRPTRL